MWWPCIMSRSRTELEYVCKASVGPATRQQTQPGKNLWTNTNTIPLTFQNGPAARRWNGNVKIGCNLGWDDAWVGPRNVCMLDFLRERYWRLMSSDWNYLPKRGCMRTYFSIFHQHIHAHVSRELFDTWIFSWAMSLTSSAVRSVLKGPGKAGDWEQVRVSSFYWIHYCFKIVSLSTWFCEACK